MKLGIIGGSGYAGGELVRLLLNHKEAELEIVTSSKYAGEYLYNIHPNLRSHTKLTFSLPNIEDIIDKCDFIFFATPHGTSKDLIPSILSSGLRVIDISADYRLKDPASYPKWYGWKHPHPDLLEESALGLPELHREEIKESKLVACPGCMATASILALYPLIKNELIKYNNIILDAKIGSSGGGALPTPANHHTERFAAIRPYNVTGHRHIAEIEQELSSMNQKVIVGFTPHAVNIARGILVTGHVWLSRASIQDRDIWRAYREQYGSEPFIRLVRSSKGLHRLPDPRNLVGTNFCDIGFEKDEHVPRLVTMSAIDNIVRGASGQAVQCFNIMNGFDERMGLDMIGIH